MTTVLREQLQSALGDDYELERELSGGMSRVFVAHQRSLGRRVVVKVFPPELAATVSTERFRREILLAARLQHPHVVPVLTASESGGLLYYTMPYVEGESLRARLDREGALPLRTATRILRDVAEALDHAHGHGVVHRDVKPENILLTGDAALVADFGVAKALSAATQGDSGAASATGTGFVLGTPLYMAPEQAAGDPAVDHRADLYALGLVAYEVLTGEHPFGARSPQALLAAQLVETPRAVEALRPEVPGPLATLVRQLLDKHPAGRPQSAQEVLRELEAAGTTSGRGAVAARARRGRRPWTMAALVAAAAVTVGAGVVASRADRGPGLTANRVVVVPFENATADRALDPLGRMAADWVTQGLAQTGLVDVVPTATALSVLRRDAAAGPGASGSGERVDALATATGAGIVVTGAYYREGDSLRFQAEITDARANKLLRAVAPVGAPLTAPLRGVEALRQHVMGALAGRMDPRLQALSANGSEPPTYEAYQQWSEGLDRFLHADYRQALQHLLRAAALDSTFAGPLLWAGAAYGNLGEHPAADSVFEVVNRSRERLAPVDRHFLDFWRALLRANAPASLEAARGMVAAAPSSELALFLLGDRALRYNRPREAIEVTRRMDPTTGTMHVWNSIYPILTTAHHVLGEHREELELARRSRRQYPDRLSALGQELRALAALGRLAEVSAKLDTSLTLPPERGVTPGGNARAAAEELRAHGHRETARTALDRALGWYAARPTAERATATSRANVGRTLYLAERWEEARARFDSLAAEHPDSLDFQGYLGVLAARRGDRAEAQRIAAALEAVQRPYLFGRHTFWRARIAALLGDRERAVSLVRDALAQGAAPHGRSGASIHREVDFEPLRDYAPFRELLRPKG